MGNKQSICKNISLTYSKFSTTTGLYIHHDKLKGYYISHNEMINIGSDLDKNFEPPYKLYPKSIVEITNFEVRNNELQLLARIKSRHSDFENIGRVWKDENQLVNVIDLFKVVPNSNLKEFNEI